MRIGILYAGKTGTTEKCAKELSNQFTEAEIIDLTKSNPEIDDYDLILIGSAIRIGQLHRKVKEFIKNNMDQLLHKRIAYFICNGFPQETDNVFENNLSSKLRENAICYRSFGGELDLKKQKGMDKFMVKMISKNSDIKKPEINQNAMKEFINCIKNSLS